MKTQQIPLKKKISIQTHIFNVICINCQQICCPPVISGL